VLDDLCAAVDSWADRLPELPFDPRQVHKLGRVVQYRRRRLAET
jgi:hypothetical protein